MKKLFLLCIILLPIGLAAQTLTQTVRGTVVDKESKFPLIGVSVSTTLEDGSILGTVSDVDGTFRLSNVPVGRRTINLSYLGYEPAILNNIVISSGREVILNVEMDESIAELMEVTVLAQRNGEVRNEMATVSARQFSVEETDRYAGSRGDPGRMASNFAGVQGADDSRNDIVIRGNSPQGVLWRLEGVNIPNPNHFAIPGTGGGPVTILNNKYLANSDFFTGAFPAEFGNSIAGAFDLKMRNGNNEKHEFSAQLGFLGTELLAEGPLSKEKKSSYLLSYRYSTLQLFTFLGIDVGTDAIPQYQDAAFRVNFPQKKGGNLAIWGLGGISNIDIILSEQEAPDTSTLIFGSNDRDQYFGSTMGVGGITWTQPTNENTYFKTTVSASYQEVNSNHDYIFRHVEDGLFVVDSLPAILGYKFAETKYSAYGFVNHKINKKQTIKAGLNVDYFQMNYLDSVRTIVVNPDPDPSTVSDWRIRWDASAGAVLVQPYVNWKLKASERLTLTAGLTSLYFSINNNSFSPLEPRLGLSYDLGSSSKLSFGYGLHSQILPGYLYYYGQETIVGDPQEHNLNLGLQKSHHLVLGYEKLLGSNLRLKAETYYQYLFDIPVEVEPSSFSLLNSGSGFSRFFPDTLANTGTGRNYGIELTLEKFFSQGYYFLITGSVFDSKYRGSDDILRNTVFNGTYAFNGVVAKEFKVGKSAALNLGGKVTCAGGRRYGPVDLEESKKQLEIIWEDEGAFTLQFPAYFRFDAKASFRWNRPKVTHEFSVDFVNVLDRENILTLTFAPDHPDGPIVEEYQLGFLPIFFYKLDF
ncbi:MAG: TonB-dependent receptor [Saprospiraceae bacterium]|nr:TonB-dependent receptor [Saprospiraceae bacterium]